MGMADTLRTILEAEARSGVGSSGVSQEGHDERVSVGVSSAEVMIEASLSKRVAVVGDGVLRLTDAEVSVYEVAQALDALHAEVDVLDTREGRVVRDAVVDARETGEELWRALDAFRREAAFVVHKARKLR